MCVASTKSGAYLLTPLGSSAVTDSAASAGQASVGPSVWTDSIEKLRVLIVAGFATGVVIAGIGSRLAMLVLRLTSPDRAIGLESDDGFRIGQFTLAGTYNLLALGAAVGFIGAVAYRAVAPWLLGKNWVRRLTTAAGAGVVVGSLIIHADGLDFNLLKPTWLAIVFFVGLPAFFGAVIGTVVDRVAAPQSWTARRPWRWAIPVVFVACFPQTWPMLIISVPVMLIWVTIRHTISADHVPTVAGLVVRAGWLAIAGWGLIALVQDVDALV